MTLSAGAVVWLEEEEEEEEEEEDDDDDEDDDIQYWYQKCLSVHYNWLIYNELLPVWPTTWPSWVQCGLPYNLHHDTSLGS
jgi:hypothetical protein